MKKSLSDLISKKYNEIAVDENIEINEINRGGEILNLLEPVHLVGKIVNLGNKILFVGKLDTVIQTVCGRCLQDIKEIASIEFEEIIYAKDNSEELDFIVETEGDYIDLYSFALNLLILKLPMKYLCNEDCKGLCPVCGINLNNSTCSCKDENLDIRLLKLKELL